jgi:hypothetical protein
MYILPTAEEDEDDSEEEGRRSMVDGVNKGRGKGGGGPSLASIRLATRGATVPVSSNWHSVGTWRRQCTAKKYCDRANCRTPRLERCVCGNDTVTPTERLLLGRAGNNEHRQRCRNDTHWHTTHISFDADAKMERCNL